MRHQTPLVSVVVMCRGDDQHLSALVQSVLEQEAVFPFEIVVANHRADDAGGHGIRELDAEDDERIRIMGPDDPQNRNLPLSAVLASCGGSYVAFADSNGLWTDVGKLQRQIDYLETHPSCIGCCHPVQTIDGAGNSSLQGAATVSVGMLTFRDWLGIDASMANSAVVRTEKATALSSGQYSNNDQWGWVLGCLAHGDIGFIGEYLSASRNSQPGQSEPSGRAERHLCRNQILRRMRCVVDRSHRQQIELQLSANHAATATKMDLQIRPDAADRHRRLSYLYGRWRSPLPLATRISHAIRPCRSLHALAVWAYDLLSAAKEKLPFAGYLITTIVRQPSWILRLGGSFLRHGGRGLRNELRVLEYLFGVSRQQYGKWIDSFDVLTGADRAAIKGRVETMSTQPVFSIVMPVYNTPQSMLKKAIESVLNQLYPHWQLCIADDASTDANVRTLLERYQEADPRICCHFRDERGNISAASNSALQLATGDYVVLLDHDDELAEHALYYVAEELNQHPDADVVYSDEDRIDAQDQRVDPYFKTDWNPDLMLSQNMICHLAAIRRDIVNEVGGFRVGFEGSQDHDLLLRCTERSSPERICHIPAVLYHWRQTPGSVSADSQSAGKAHEAGQRALQEHLQRQEIDASVEIVSGKGAPHYRVQYALPDPPLVSVIIPTKDSVDLLRRCVEGLLQDTGYPNLDIIVVDNGSRDEAALKYLESLTTNATVRVLEYSGDFNYSAINNYAVSQATGTVLCLLNNDTEIIHGDWLTEMVSHAVRPSIGAVGAKLLYPDDCIQHAGVLIGYGGGAGHTFSGLPVETPVQHGRLDVIQNVSCVTAACMVLQKSVFEQMGGFDEEELQVAYNDVDLCLRIVQAGYRIVWTPYAQLYHHESASRGESRPPEEMERDRREGRTLKRRWCKRIAADSHLNPNVSVNHLDYRPAFPPRGKRPWL